jgi:hypothetical protein
MSSVPPQAFDGPMREVNGNDASHGTTPG